MRAALAEEVEGKTSSLQGVSAVRSEKKRETFGLSKVVEKPKLSFFFSALFPHPRRLSDTDVLHLLEDSPKKFLCDFRALFWGAPPFLGEGGANLLRFFLRGSYNADARIIERRCRAVEALLTSSFVCPRNMALMLYIVCVDKTYSPP